MLLIVAHHSVFHSGVMEEMAQNPLCAKSIFFYVFGMWGRTGIDCFVLITGYFMCKSHITIQKYLKLLFGSHLLQCSDIWHICGNGKAGIFCQWIVLVNVPLPRDNWLIRAMFSAFLSLHTLSFDLGITYRQENARTIDSAMPGHLYAYSHLASVPGFYEPCHMVLRVVLYRILYPKLWIVPKA